MKRALLVLILLVVVSLGDTTTVSLDSSGASLDSINTVSLDSSEVYQESINTSQVVDTFSSDTIRNDSSQIAIGNRVEDVVPAHKKKRYKVVSAVMMMLFVGIAMGTSQSNNPK